MKKKTTKPPLKFKCFVCGKTIPQERVKFLLSINTPVHEMTTVDCSQTKRKKGVYMGEAGTSEMKIVDKVYNDSVRDVFRKSADDVEEDEPEEEVIPTPVDSKMKKHYDEMRDEEKES